MESERDAVALAQRLGLDAGRFAADLRKHEVRAEVERQRGLCKAAGVRAVPTFFINGRKLIGSLPTSDFQRVIDEERR
ncbi:MAG: thioredoxin domain-containing protein [Myxococcales bacterium]|nr:thioredoxin domain-containing protein [Myxococcales bacterium]